MEISAGIVIVYRKEKILICHPINRRWDLCSFPKGKIEDGESILEAAIRETKEEVGLDIDPEKIQGKSYVCSYTDLNGKISKKIHYFIYHIDEYSEVGMDSDSIPIEKLNPEETDFAKFCGYHELRSKLYWKMFNVLRLVEGNKTKFLPTDEEIDEASNSYENSCYYSHTFGEDPSYHYKNGIGYIIEYINK